MKHRARFKKFLKFDRTLMELLEDAKTKSKT